MHKGYAFLLNLSEIGIRNCLFKIANNF